MTSTGAVGSAGTTLDFYLARIPNNYLWTIIIQPQWWGRKWVIADKSIMEVSYTSLFRLFGVQVVVALFAKVEMLTSFQWVVEGDTVCVLIPAAITFAFSHTSLENNKRVSAA